MIATKVTEYIRPTLVLSLMVVLLSLLYLGASPLYGAERELIRTEKRYEDVKRKIREGKKDVKEIKKKESGILSQLDKLSREITERRANLKKVERSIKRTKGEIRGTGKKIEVLEREKKSLRERLSLRLRSIYKMQKGGTLGMLVSTGPTEARDRIYKYMSIIMNDDATLIEEAEANLISLNLEKKRLASLEASLSQSRKDLKRSKGEMEAARKRQERVLKGVVGEKKKQLALVRELEVAAKELADLIGSLSGEGDIKGLSSGFGRMKGRLKMPIKGRVVSRYGKVKHPKFNTYTFNNGIIIEGEFGKNAKSVYDGTVVYTGWLKGYGQVMIMDHGGGFYTLFAHLYKMLKSKGDKVKKGEDVALIGESGAHGSPGLYFEIRQKGVPRDPSGWFASR